MSSSLFSNLLRKIEASLISASAGKVNPSLLANLICGPVGLSVSISSTKYGGDREIFSSSSIRGFVEDITFVFLHV